PLFEIGNGNTTSSNALTVLKNGTITAPSFDLSEITNSKALITKEYLEANVSSPTGLENINEGNGAGWRLVGVDPNNYGNVGLNAVDLSINLSTSSTSGATGIYSYASGLGAIASGISSSAIGNSTSAIGNYSTVLGYSSLATGDYSTAIGYFGQATGEQAIALGNSYATGNQSLSFGYLSASNGRSSIALGSGLIVDAYGAMSIGNLNVGGGNPNSWVATDPLFEIGNGTSSSNRTNALTVLKNGTITAPSFDIVEITDPKALITKEYLESTVSGLELITEGTSVGWRIVGRNPDYYGDIGVGAIDLSGSTSNSTVNGATGINSVAMGTNTIASGSYSIVAGYSSQAIGSYSTAMGESVTASGISSVAMGAETTASGDNSVAFGSLTEASGENSLVAGTYTQATAFASSAFGFANLADDSYATVLGHYNDYTASTTTLLQVGNGSTSNTRSNALTVLENGYTAIGTHNVAPTTDFQVYHDNDGTVNGLKLQNKGGNDNWWRFYTLNSNGQLYLYSKAGGNSNAVGSFDDVSGAYTALSDRRVKDNFKELYFDWENFMKLTPLTYYYKADTTKQSHIGFVAQDVQPIYPELVNYNQEDDLYQLNYSGFGVVAIKAIQELKKEINVLTEENKKLKSLIDNQEQASAEQSETLQALLKRVEALEKQSVGANLELVKN
ncbi:MAG TPA: tail fiber domain-containing protein, partial [Mangrovimonas sp.]|nr:tail fiber domain-containing protein [Mangrovimonas sp.]